MDQQMMQFEAKIYDIEKINPLFSKCRVKVLYTGLNRNNTYFTKDVVNKAIPTIYNIPIVGEFIEEIDDFGSHGGKIEITDRGVKFVETTKPYGVVPESAKVYWENVTEENGIEREYLVIDGAYLWTGRYQEAQKVIEEGRGQSMEIVINEGKFNKDKVYEIDDFTFSALCILGNDVEPCFESASIVAYSLNKEEFKKEFSLMLKELKESLNFAEEKIEIDNSKDAANMTGSWSSVDKTALRNKLVSASNATELVKEAYLIVDEGWEEHPSESLHYPHHEVRDGKLIVHKRGLQAALSRLKANDPNNQDALNHLKRHYRELGLDMSNFDFEGGTDVGDVLETKAGENVNQDDVQKDFVLSMNQLRNEINAELQVEKYIDDNGYTFQRYWLVDVDETKVIVEDMAEGYRLFAFNYTVSDNKVTIDFESKQRVKIQYVPFEENDIETTFEIVSKVRFEHELQNKEKQIEEKYTNKINEIESELNNVKEQYAQLENEVNELRQFKTNTLAEQRKVAEEELFERFSTILSQDEIAEIKEKASEFELNELEEKLYALVGKKQAKFNLNKKDNKSIKIELDLNTDNKKSGKPYDYLFEKYTSK